MTMLRCIHFKNNGFTLKIHFLAVISVFALIFAESSVYSFVVLFCAAFHELGHFIMIKLCGADVSEFSFLPFGAEMRIKGELGYSKEAAVAVFGPFFNLLLCFIFAALLYFFPSPLFLFGVMCSAYLMLINLVPVRGFDGGRIVRCVFFSHMEYEKALKMIHISELLSLILLSFAAVWTVIFCSFNISLAVICLYLFFWVYAGNTE